jgi:TolA-binding protein
MDSHNPLPKAHFRGFRRLVLSALALLAAGLSPLAAQSEEARPRRPDQVIWRNTKGADSKLTGIVTENSLTRVTVQVGDKTRNRDAAVVQMVIFGDVPESYDEGMAYAERGEHESAAAKFRLAAGDPNSRDVVKAAARLRAAIALMNQGVKDPNAFALSRDEFQRFLDEHADNREVPTARFHLGRMQLLTGDPKQASRTYRALYKEASGDTASSGYPVEICYRAGLAAADCFLKQEDTFQAREIYAEMEALIPRSMAAIDESDVGTLAILNAIRAQARLGEGYCQLVGGNTAQAKSFFQGHLDAAETRDSALRNGARLGLAETLLAEGEYRQAQIEFAKVSAIDHTNPDRVARALVGLAECALQLTDGSAKNDARLWLQTVQDHYGNTPAILRAQELSKNL